MTTVTFYRDETTCKCCGRYIVNVIAIDGIEYGTTCGEYQIKQLAGTIEVKGKSIDFAANAENIIAEQNKARRVALFAQLPRMDWHMNTPVNELGMMFLARLDKPVAAQFAARLELSGINPEAVVAAEYRRAMME